MAIIFTLTLIIKGENKYYLIKEFKQRKARRTLISSKNLWENPIKIIAQIIYFKKSFNIRLLLL